MEEKKRIEEDEIDLVALLQTLWKGRKTILKWVAILGLIGFCIAIFSPKEYTATTVMVPVSSEKNKVGGNLGGLAAMAGINLSGSGSNASIPTTLYPKVVQSIPFKKALVETPLTVSEVKGHITFKDYYRNVYDSGFLAGLKKYTIGLPGLILRSLKSSQNVGKKVEDSELLFVHSEEKELYNRLEDKVVLEVNDKDGYVRLSASMPEAIAAAQLALRAQSLLQTYIIDFKSKKAREQLEFIEERYAEKQKDFQKAEYALANFRDRNKNVVSARAATQESRLKAEYNLAYTVYSELAKQIEQQKIQVKEDTPVFTTIEPVSVPAEKSKPRRAMILAIWLFLGGVVGVGVVLGREFIKNIKEKKE